MLSGGRPMSDRALQHQVRELVSEGVVKVRWHPRLDKAPSNLAPGVRLTDKVEGMLLGIAIGDALGNTSESMNPNERRRAFGWIDGYLPNRHANERAVGLPSDDTQLAFWTVEHLLRRGALDPQELGELFAQPDRQIFGGGRTTAAALANLRRGVEWTHSGSPGASNGALMRISVVLLPHLMKPSPALWTDTLAAAHVTHDDELSNSSCVALVDTLWKLLGMDQAPHGAWWLNQFAKAFTDIGCSKPYAARAGHPPGFNGTVCELLAQFVAPALDGGLDAAAAGDIWHSGAYLLETVPTVIFILSRYGHDPRAAVEQAVNGTRDNDTVAAIVGAAVGALHGASAWPDSWVSGLLGRTRHDDDGRLFRLMLEAGDRFGYGVTPLLRRLAARRMG